jgi:hypothetical protein
LLRFDRETDVTPLVAAAAKRRLPLKVLDVDVGRGSAVSVPDAYSTKLVLSRPDRHVGWRGNAVPLDSLPLVDRMRGAA